MNFRCLISCRHGRGRKEGWGGEKGWCGVSGYRIYLHVYIFIEASAAFMSCFLSYVSELDVFFFEDEVDCVCGLAGLTTSMDW